MHPFSLQISGLDRLSRASIAVLLTATVFTAAGVGASRHWLGQIGRCGNGVVESGEQCDDANINNYDGCAVGCTILTGWVCTGTPSKCKQTCGDGTMNKEAGEECDDGWTKDGDGCSRVCRLEKGFTCEGSPSSCWCKNLAQACGLTSCGNGVLNIGEVCDDGNSKDGDGCNKSCAPEAGFVCHAGSPSRCSKDIVTLLEQQKKLRMGLK